MRVVSQSVGRGRNGSRPRRPRLAVLFSLLLDTQLVQDALPRLPEDVQVLGVQVRKATPSILLAIHLYSPDKSRDTLYLSNYLTLHVKDELARLHGVGDVQFQGGREYAMRIWLAPDKIAAHDLSASEVLAALRAQNLQVSAGVLNRPPVPVDQAYQINVEARGRLSTPEEDGVGAGEAAVHAARTRLRPILMTSFAFILGVAPLAVATGAGAEMTQKKSPLSGTTSAVARSCRGLELLALLQRRVPCSVSHKPRSSQSRQRQQLRWLGAFPSHCG